MEAALNESEHTQNSSISVREDIADIFLNPHLYAISQEHYWSDGVALLAITCLGVLSNLYLISRLTLKCTTSETRVLLLVSLTDLAVLAALATRRIPLIFAGSEWTGETFPLLQFYLIPVEKGLLTFSAFIFLIFIGQRFLQTAEHRTYSCLNTGVFCLSLSILISLSGFFELRMERLTRTEVELEVGQNTSLVMELREENSVITHTDLFYHKTYSQLVRLLLNFICSQVSVVWFLPIIFLHSKHLNKVNQKQRKTRDLLTPTLSVLYILLSLPNLALLIHEILLYMPPTYLMRMSVLCLSLMSSVKLILYLSLDKTLRRELLCIKTHSQIPSQEV